MRVRDCHQKNNGDTKGVIKSGKSLKDRQHHGQRTWRRIQYSTQYNVEIKILNYRTYYNQGFIEIYI